MSARRGGGNAGSIAAGEVKWAGRRTVLDARSLDAVARARRRCLRALLAFLPGGVLRQSRQRLPRPRGHHSHVITGCTCAQRTRHAERDAPPTRRGKDLYVCAPGSALPIMACERLDVKNGIATTKSRACAQTHDAVGSKLAHRRPRAGAYFVRRWSSGGVRHTLCWGRVRAGSRRPGAGHRPRTAGAQIGGGRGSPSRWRPCLTASEVGGRRSATLRFTPVLQLYNL